MPLCKFFSRKRTVPFAVNLLAKSLSAMIVWTSCLMLNAVHAAAVFCITPRFTAKLAPQ